MEPNLLSNLVNDAILAERRQRAQSERHSLLVRMPRNKGKTFPYRFIDRLNSFMDGIRLRRAPAPQVVLACTGQVVCCLAGGCQL